MTDQAAPALTTEEEHQRAYRRLWQQHHSLLTRLQIELDRTRGSAPPLDLLDWAQRALIEDIPLDVLADAFPYSGAGPDEASALIDDLADAGWIIVPTPRSA